MALLIIIIIITSCSYTRQCSFTARFSVILTVVYRECVRNLLYDQQEIRISRDSVPGLSY